MIEREQFTAHNYPRESSEITTDATGFGYLGAVFEHSITEFGNDSSLSWPSYSEPDASFSVRYDGQGTVVQEGTTWPVWLLTLNRGDHSRILKVDVATCSIEEWTDGGFKDAGFLGNSDLVASVMNLQRFARERREEGDSRDAAFRRFMRMMHPPEPFED